MTNAIDDEDYWAGYQSDPMDDEISDKLDDIKRELLKRESNVLGFLTLILGTGVASALMTVGLLSAMGFVH